MPNWLKRLSQSPFLPLGLFIFLLTVAALCGGGSRADIQSQIFPRVAAILVLLVLALLPARVDGDRLRLPLLFVALCALVIGVQLIDLPPQWWLNLPGRDFYAEAAWAAGIEQPSRPINLTPDLGWNSLLSLLPPAAALVAALSLAKGHRRLILPALIGVVLLSAFLGVLQISAGGSGLVLYRVANEGLPIGLFANRNHQAILLALALPMLGALANRSDHRSRFMPHQAAIAFGIGLLLIPLILLTGSRLGLVLAVIGAGCAFLLCHQAIRNSKIMRIAVPGALLLLVGLTVWFSRAETFKRLTQDQGDELRITMLPTLLEIGRNFAPVGSGFGSFDTVFRRFEPEATLRLNYFNHAHNDYLELWIEGGLAAILLVAAFLIWWVVRSFKVWFRHSQSSEGIVVARLGSMLTLMLMIASGGDYPLRTPLMAVIFAIACACMTGRFTASHRSDASRQPPLPDRHG